MLPLWSIPMPSTKEKRLIDGMYIQAGTSAVDTVPAVIYAASAFEVLYEDNNANVNIKIKANDKFIYFFIDRYCTRMSLIGKLCDIKN